jgi:hypothetical protein
VKVSFTFIPFLVTDLPLNLRCIFIHCLLHFKGKRGRRRNSQHAPLIPNQFLLLSSVRVSMMMKKKEGSKRCSHRRLFKFARIPSKIFKHFALSFMSISLTLSLSISFRRLLESLLVKIEKSFLFGERKT